MTTPTPPAPHAQTLEQHRAKFERAIGLLSLELPEAVYRDFTAIADGYFAALRAREDAPDGTRAALRDVAIVVRDLAASEWADVAILPEWLRDLMRGRFGSTDGIAWPTITWRQLAAALAASPAPARSLADQLDDDYCSPAPSDDGGPR